MFTKKALAAAMVAVLPLMSMTASVSAQPMTRDMREAPRGPSIRGFNVDEVRRLEPGAELNFDLYGTPGGIATLRIDGATRNLALTETEPGQYEGSYIISARDRITADSAVTANLREGNRVATQVLAESLQRGPRDRPRGGEGMAPRVERFDVRGADDLTAGDQLTFTLMGTPGAKVEVTIAGSRGIFFLPEVRPGEYSGVYTVRRNDRIMPDSAVTATIRNNGRYTTAVLGRPLIGAGPRPAQQAARYCSNCAVVEAVNVVQVAGNGNYLGTIGGAVVGGLLGNQVGSGNGRTAASIAGAVGGAALGRNYDNNASARNGANQHYEVMVRYTNGATRVVTYANDPGFRVGEKVRVDNNLLTRDQ